MSLRNSSYLTIAAQLMLLGSDDPNLIFKNTRFNPIDLGPRVNNITNINYYVYKAIDCINSGDSLIAIIHAIALCEKQH